MGRALRRCWQPGGGNRFVPTHRESNQEDNSPTFSLCEELDRRFKHLKPPTVPIREGEGNGRRLPFTLDSDKRFLEVNRGKGKSKDNENRTKRTYKEVLLLQPRRIHPPTATFQQCSPPRRYPPRRHVSSVGRCFRCLAKDHRVKECRDPIRCSGCFKTGYLVRHCRKCGPLSSSTMHRAMQFRLPSRKVFVPITEGFHTRQQQCQNAVLANVVRSATLGHLSQETIATDFANFFEGFSNAFLVACHSKRDFVIFLPLWVRAEDLIRRGIVNLAHCQLRCYSWNPYRDATRSRLTYKVWIRLVDLPFECWCEARVAAIVNSFGRYLRVDEKSINMLDLIGFRCQIAVDDLAEVPENLAITLGDLVVNVIVQLETSAPFGGDD
uniref:Uncharacterized protein n=1 Tax=Ananas comosus var. bracteatus TaxID=296719 RepID=A0A6V7QHS4_ANACO|nr:unnamed protein product [Ananas comosus var. bracteatus]